MKRLKVIYGSKTGVILNSLYRGLMQGGAFGEQSHRVARNPSTFCHKRRWRITLEDVPLNPRPHEHESRFRRSLWSATDSERD